MEKEHPGRAGQAGYWSVGGGGGAGGGSGVVRVGGRQHTGMGSRRESGSR